MVQEFNIIEAEPEDSGVLLEFMKHAGADTDFLTYGAEGLPFSREQEAEFLKQMHQDKHSVFFCAWKGERLAGTVSLNGLQRRMDHSAELGIVVGKDFWNMGLGAILMQKVIDYARDNEIELIRLEVRSDNHSARNLYQKVGFRLAGTIPSAMKIKDRYYDLDIMYLDLRY